MSNEINDLIKQRQRQAKNKKNQIPYGIMVILIAVILCIVLWQSHYKYAVCLILGVGIGIVLRFSRFCFAAAFREPFLIGNTKLIRAILLGMMVSTIGFALIQSHYIHGKIVNYQMIPGEVNSVGIHVMIGAFMFGIGMVLAGGCSSGVLMRIGEGHLLHIVVLVGFFIGTILGAKDYSFWFKNIIHNAKIIYFPEHLDFKIVVAVQMIVLVILYVLALWYEKRRCKDA
ncbi:YeeE/YedE thiosulfate transporter family protein [Haloimpatiens sp. FM7330]|uniref:YeeE/YedE thiosulfate transporter family protein n=1 Tax=Haloimpatiens sp. FM7330 TaxID=3298610 RepID=UPI00364439BB